VAQGSDQELVDQRMARIRQQVLSRPQLIELIQRNDLYTTELNSRSLTEVIEKMRKAISIEPVTADIQQAGSGRKTTIAFGMSFEYSDPVKVQTVAQALTEQVLQIDSTQSAEHAENTVQFLTDQANGLQEQMGVLEKQIASIKSANGMALAGGSMSVIGASTGSYDAQIAAIQQANAQLRAQKEGAKTSDQRDPIVTQAEATLAAVQATYSDSHPDVILAKQRLAEARSLAKQTAGKLPTDSIDRQIAANNQQLSILQSARAQESARTGALIGAASRAPVVQQEIAQLQQRLDGLNVQYQGVSSRLLAARAGKKAEDDQQGERLSVIDPPVIPDEPASPNRPLLIAGGLVAGIGLGIVLAGLLELVFRPIRDISAVQAATGEAPLVVIPTISGKTGQQKSFFQRFWPFGKQGKKNDIDDDDD
jgi:uncharacterized protein involved in exopolysaccharide biosynthesis